MRLVLAGCLVWAFCLLQGAQPAKAASIVGTWKGSGTARLKAGGVEAVSCRVRYEASTGRTFVLYVKCAHANGAFKVSGRVVALSGSTYSGRLYSDQYDVSGDVTISVRGKSQTLTAKSPKGTATVRLRKQ